MPDSLENLYTSVTGCRHEASVQADSASATDAKLLGILAFMGAAASLLLTVDHGVEGYRWILLVGAVGAIVLTLVGLVGGEDTRSGPDPVDFYNKHGGTDTVSFSRQLIADFTRTLEQNTARVEARRKVLSASFAWAIAAGAAFAFARGLGALLS